MSFLETPRFPVDISYGSTFSTRRNTSVVSTQSGHEWRNRNWSASRKQYDIGYGTRSQAQAYAVIEFFEAVGGRADAFRFKDWSDYKSLGPDDTPANDDQNFGTGDGSTVAFQLTKTYTKGALSFSRTITKPVSGTILIAVNAVAQTEGGGNDYTIDYTTGIVTFNSAPTSGHAITWGGEFDVPVRFDQDELTIDIRSLDAASLSIPLVEVRDIA